MEVRDHKKVIMITSFQIGNNSEHRIILAYSDSLNQNNLKYYLAQSIDKANGITTISGLYINNALTTDSISKKYTDWI